jgi:uncharacterized protein (UPF0548 family)
LMAVGPTCVGLCAGEERFSVCYEGAGGNVYFDMLSFSKGSFPLGTMVLPLIRPLQAGGGCWGVMTHVST